MSRRRKTSSGFVLTEALVALAIAAMTVALLTSATWGLRMASDKRQTAELTSAVDWLAARRALHDWSSGVTATGKQDAARYFFGTATSARMYIEPTSAGQLTPFVGELRVEALDENRFALIAARHMALRDARVTDNTPQETQILQANAPIRLLYLLARQDGIGMTWRYETGSGDEGLPVAVAVEVGDERMVTTPIFATRSASCLSRLGTGGLDNEECALR